MCCQLILPMPIISSRVAMVGLPGSSNVPLLRELEAAEKHIYSQHGEDGVIQALLEMLPPCHRFVVEFGAHDGESMSNSRHLIVDHDWHAVLLEPHLPFSSSCCRRAMRTMIVSALYRPTLLLKTSINCLLMLACRRISTSCQLMWTGRIIISGRF